MPFWDGSYEESFFPYICIEKHNKNHLLKKNIRGLELLLSAFTHPFLKQKQNKTKKKSI